MQAAKLQIDGFFLWEKPAIWWQSARRMPLRYWQRLVSSLLLLGLAVVVARAIWLLVPNNQVMPLASVSSIDHQPATQLTPTITLQELKALRLFGNTPKVNVGATKSSAMVVNAAETKLDLKLQGVISSNVAAEARAIIAYKNAQDSFAPGDALPVPGQVSLIEVLDDRAIISNGGRYESLWLYDEKGNKIVRPTQTMQARPAATQPIGAAKTPEGAAVPHHTPRKVSAELVERASSFDDVIQFTMAREGNRIIGYRIGPGRASGVFDQAGFKNNDIVTAVNGVTLDDPNKALSIYRQIRSERAASFSVLRDGEVLTIDVALDDSNV